MKHSWQSRLRCAAQRSAQALESRARVSGWPLMLPLVGLAALVWVALRVLPKPTRATYPCQRVAMPLASGFLVWLLAPLGVHLALRRAWKHLRAARYWAAGACAFAGLVAGAWMLLHSERPVAADYAPHPVNAPIGMARGTHPGRVTWVFDPLATNQTSANTSGDYWWYDQAEGIVNTDPDQVELMLSRTLQTLTGASTDAEAWDALFRYSNQSRGLGDVGYQPGQKIAIKVNMNSGWPGNVVLSTYQKVNYLGMADTSPQLMHAMLKQLIEVAGVAPEDISIGDPLRYFFNQFYNKLVGDYPTVRYLDHEGRNGRVWAEPSDEPAMKYSDTDDPTRFDKLPKAFIEADYMINMAALKGHDGAGITLCAKNHYGSHARSGAEHLHYTLPGPPPQYGGLTGMGHYRVLVDLMGHKDLGGKTMLFLVDGLWGAKYSIGNPVKWKSAPFSNRWPSSLLASQDGVAIESVGLDFLQSEYNETNYPGETHYPYYDGTEDYIHQAADPANWPAGITYDPERDGTPLGSLGVHEHWNNPTDKQYTRNLQTGDGIELITVGDLPVEVAVIATQPAAAEVGEVPGELMISRTGDMSTDVTVSFSLSGTATPGTDYGSLPTSVTIPADQSVARLAVVPIDDSLLEGDETVILTLAAGPGYSVDAARAEATATIADDATPPMPLTVSTQGSGSGHVTSDPSGIDCHPSCNVSFPLGTGVDLTATPDTGSAFAGWSGACSGTGLCHVAMDDARSVVATFALLTLSIENFSIIEGDSGTTTATVTVTLSPSSSPAPARRPSP
jgi:hypothetical protein